MTFFHFKLPLSFGGSVEFISLLTAAKMSLGLAVPIGPRDGIFGRGPNERLLPARFFLAVVLSGELQNDPPFPPRIRNIICSRGCPCMGQKASRARAYTLGPAFSLLFFLPRTISLEFGCLGLPSLGTSRPTTRLGASFFCFLRARVFRDRVAGRTLRCGIHALVGTPGSQGKGALYTHLRKRR